MPTSSTSTHAALFRCGYARVSSLDQNFSIQEAALRAAGATITRSEKKSGTTTKGRDELATLIEFAHAGDTIIITRIDRLAEIRRARGTLLL